MINALNIWLRVLVGSYMLCVFPCLLLLFATSFFLSVRVLWNGILMFARRVRKGVVGDIHQGGKSINVVRMLSGKSTVLRTRYI